MKYTPPPFDNSDEAIVALKKEHEEAQEFVFGWLHYIGLQDADSGLDFEDVFAVMAEYKRQSNPQQSNN